MDTTYKRYCEDGSGASDGRRSYYWKTAIGLNRVDGLVPSDYLLRLRDESIEGRKTYSRIEEELHDYYSALNVDAPDVRGSRECDIVSTRIARLLESEAFVFSPVTLKNIHKRLFDGLFTGALEGYAGRFRDYNITKAEPLLNGKGVIYGDYLSLDDYLRYDFDNESNINYAVLSKAAAAANLSRFISSVWQVHPFAEGNTRTCAVFLEKYMRFLGYAGVRNDMFSEHSIYFRDALAASNYSDAQGGIRPDFSYLEAFLLCLVEDGSAILPTITLRRAD